ncbi:MAG: kinase [Steroidobacteraceae bacterium]|jgi:NAD+ kinase|nr:kinase [Steroidobacteraceae bacterium]MBM2853202.1 kinase [Steroidobacteraceae bacterium]
MNKRFSRIALVGKVEDARVADSMVTLARHLRSRGLVVLVDASSTVGDLPGDVERRRIDELAGDADLIVAIGGDGTMLFAAQLAIGRDIPLLGINRGRLGFLTDVSPDDMIESFDSVLQGRYETDARNLLEARLTPAKGPPAVRRALNDVVVQRHESGRMVELETWIDGQFVNRHGGDGLVIASSTGSTAYALSCGGPIIHPSLDALVIAPISPHTLSDRPIVIGRNSRVEVRLVERSGTRAQVTCDGMLLGDLEASSSLVMGPAAGSITLLHPPGYDYFRLLRSKLHWGRSARSGRMEH